MKWREACRWVHVHAWMESAWNTYGIASEQRCPVCLEYRHRILSADTPLGESEPWLPGPHPIAQRLRDEGKVKTDNWSGSWDPEKLPP
jgi:hypothetical protein